MTFEKAILRLEEIVKKLEDGSAPLEASLKLFEEGVGLVRFCSGSLDRAEQKVKVLIETGDGAREEDFAGAGEGK